MRTATSLTTAIALTSALSNGACNPFEPPCEEAVSLIDLQGWTLVPPERDPFVEGDPNEFFAPPNAPAEEDDRPRLCDESQTQPTQFGADPAFDIDTQLGCNWATLEQPLIEDLREGDDFTLRIFYFSQLNFPAAEAQVVVKLGDDVLADERVPIPTGSGLIGYQIPSPVSATKGERALWHVGNHGDNSWNFLELSTFRPAECPKDEGDT